MKILLILILIHACSHKPYSKTQEIIDLVHKNSIAKVKNVELVKNSGVDDQSDEFYKKFLKEIGGAHSVYIPKSLAVDGISGARFNCKKTLSSIKGHTLNNIGIVRVPALFNFESTSTCSKEYVAQLTKVIHNLDKINVNGWVIDLRFNNGGNMYPMLAGLSPLLPKGVLGYFINKKNKKIGWKHDNGKIFLGSEKVVQNSNHFKLKSKKRIAILAGSWTGSSGEFVLVSFLKSKDVKFFGEPTYGFTTGNEIFKLKDGSMVALTTTFAADKEGKSIRGKIKPDQTIDLKKKVRLIVNEIINSSYFSKFP